MLVRRCRVCQFLVLEQELTPTVCLFFSLVTNSTFLCALIFLWNASSRVCFQIFLEMDLGSLPPSSEMQEFFCCLDIVGLSPRFEKVFLVHHFRH